MVAPMPLDEDAAFHIAVSDDVLDDLRHRLTRTRFTNRSANVPWQGGADPNYLQELVEYWVDGFEWRRHESELNARPHYRVEIDGRAVHFVRTFGVRPEGSAPRFPLILSHGWPSSFVEMLPLVDRLTDPARFGADPADAFDVIVPSLPGFIFSEVPDGPVTRARLAQILHSLMTDVLGYERYGAFGGDIGGATSSWMATLFPEQVAGLHLIHPPFPASFDDRPMTPAEQAFIDAEEEYDKSDGGYSAIMATRPDTVAAALIDSPAGLAAWIIDKFRDWSDCHGDVESRFDRDTLLTIVMLYWVTGSIGPSFRQYFDWNENAPRPDITVPAAITLSTEPLLANFPREISERACTNIMHWSEPGKGGHFMPWEEPDLLAGEMRQFFSSL
jgi:pimeloyl-ACP methyl ester carboxylesterase